MSVNDQIPKYPRPLQKNRIETFEDILSIIGNDGKINFLLFFCAAIGGLITPLHTFSYQFLGGTPQHWCHVDELEPTNWTSDQIRNLSSPIINSDDGAEFASCVMYDLNYTSLLGLSYDEAYLFVDELLQKNQTTKSCSQRDFDGDIETIVTKWDLVCERRALYSTTQAAVQGGMLIGSLSAGYLMDRMGRIKVYKACVILYCLCGFASAFSPTIGVFIILKVFSAMVGFGFYLAGFVFSMEMCSTKQRSSVGNYYVIPWAFGMMLCAIISYLVRPWYLLQIAFTVPSLLLFGNFWVLRESPRWLILNGRHEEAFKILRTIAKANKKVIPDKETFLEAMNYIEIQSKESNEENIGHQTLFQTVTGVLKNILALLVNPQLRIRTVCVFICFFSVSMVYYGVSLGSTTLSTNAYLYVFIGGALELPSYLLLWPTVSALGRKKSLIMFYVLSAISILAVMVLFLTDNANNSTYNSLKLALFLLGKFSITPAFHLSWVFTAELFPTKYRSLAVGEANCIARVGSICSPYINDLMSEIAPWSPAAIFGIMSVVGGLLTLPLPETTIQVLPDSIGNQKAYGGTDTSHIHNPSTMSRPKDGECSRL